MFGQPRRQVNDGADFSGQGARGDVFQGFEFPKQGFQGRTVYGEDTREGLLGAHHRSGQRTLASGPTLPERRQQVHQHALEEFRREGEQAFAQGGLGDFDRACPEQLFSAQHFGQLADGRHLPPQHHQHSRYHDWQAEKPVTQTETTIIGQLPEDGRGEQRFQPFSNDFIVGARTVSPAHMVGIAGFGLFAHVSMIQPIGTLILPEESLHNA